MKILLPIICLKLSFILNVFLQFCFLKFDLLVCVHILVTFIVGFPCIPFRERISWHISIIYICRGAILFFIPTTCPKIQCKNLRTLGLQLISFRRGSRELIGTDKSFDILFCVSDYYINVLSKWNVMHMVNTRSKGYCYFKFYFYTTKQYDVVCIERRKTLRFLN